MPNYTGSTGYGEKYVQGLIGKCGTLDVADCIATVEELIKLGLSEPGRQIVNGGSHGGFLAAHRQFTSQYKLTLTDECDSDWPAPRRVLRRCHAQPRHLGRRALHVRHPRLGSPRVWVFVRARDTRHPGNLFRAPCCLAHCTRGAREGASADIVGRGRSTGAADAGAGVLSCVEGDGTGGGVARVSKGDTSDRRRGGCQGGVRGWAGLVQNVYAGKVTFRPDATTGHYCLRGVSNHVCRSA